MKGKKVCWHHGGKSLSGLAHPNYSTGKYSRHLPSQLGTAYRQARHDPELHSLRDEIALAEARVHELLQGLQDTPGSQDTVIWEHVNAQLDRLSRLRLNEHKRLIDLQLVITQDQANVLLGALVAIVTEVIETHVSDVAQQRRMFGALSRGLEVHLGLGIGKEAEA